MLTCNNKQKQTNTPPAPFMSPPAHRLVSSFLEKRRIALQATRQLVKAAYPTKIIV